VGRLRLEVDEQRDRVSALVTSRDQSERQLQSEKASSAHWKASAEREMQMRAQLERDHEKAVKRRAELASQVALTLSSFINNIIN
jgi:hypothetical protein